MFSHYQLAIKGISITCHVGIYLRITNNWQKTHLQISFNFTVRNYLAKFASWNYTYMFMEFILLLLAYNLHACQNARNLNLAYVFLTCTCVSANYCAYV